MTFGSDHLHRCGQQAVRLAELLGQDDELTHRFGAGHTLVRLIHPLLHFGAHRRVGGGLLHRHIAVEALAFQPGAQRLLVKRHQRGDERALVAEHQRLRDELAALDDLFDRAGGDVLAAGGDDQILLAAGDVQEAVVVDAGPGRRCVYQPSSVNESFGRLLVLVVLREHRGALDLNLLVLGDTQLEPGERDADGTLMVRHAERVERARRGRLASVRSPRTPARSRRGRTPAVPGPAGRRRRRSTGRGRRARRAATRRPSGRTPRDGPWPSMPALPLALSFLHVVLRGDHRGGERHALRRRGRPSGTPRCTPSPARAARRSSRTAGPPARSAISVLMPCAM